MLNIKERIISIIMIITYIVAFILMIIYSLDEELKVVDKQEQEYLKYIENNKQR